MLILLFPILPSHPLLLIRLLLDGGLTNWILFGLFLTMFKIGLKFVVVVDGV